MESAIMLFIGALLGGAIVYAIMCDKVNSILEDLEEIKFQADDVKEEIDKLNALVVDNSKTKK